MRRISIIFLGILLFFNLSHAKIKLIEKSKRKKPEWITVPPEKKGYYFFIGVAQNQPSLTEGINKAVEEALRQVLTVIGIVVGSKTEIQKQMKGDKYIARMLDEYKEVGRAKVKGHRIKEIYTEEYLDTDTGKRFYDVYLLLRYSQSEIKKERERIQREQRENRSKAAGILKEAKNFEKNGKILKAYIKYADVLSLLQDQPSIYEYNTALLSIKRILNSIILKGISKKRKIIIEVISRIGEKLYPVEDVKLIAKIEKGTGTITSSSITDVSGKADFTISKIKFEGGIAKVKVSFSKEQFLSNLENLYITESDLRSLKNIIEEKTVEVVLKSSEFGFSKTTVIIWKKRGGRSPQAEDIISSTLIDSGINVITLNRRFRGINYRNFETEDFFNILKSKGIEKAVLGEIELIDNGKVYSLYSVTGVLKLKIISVKEREVLTTIEETKNTVDLNFDKAAHKVIEFLSKKLSPKIIELLSL